MQVVGPIIWAVLCCLITDEAEPLGPGDVQSSVHEAGADTLPVNSYSGAHGVEAEPFWRVGR